MNEIRIELNTYNLVQIIIVMCLFIILLGVVIYYCVSLENQQTKKELLDNNSNLGNTNNTSANLSFNHSFVSND